MDKAIIKKTHDPLGKAIKKPPLLEKLLNKPPFRFIHDILTEVVKTGVFEGLYSDPFNVECKLYKTYNTNRIKTSMTLDRILDKKILLTTCQINVGMMQATNMVKCRVAILTMLRSELETRLVIVFISFSFLIESK